MVKVELSVTMVIDIIMCFLLYLPNKQHSLPRPVFDQCWPKYHQFLFNVSCAPGHLDMVTNESGKGRASERKWPVDLTVICPNEDIWRFVMDYSSEKPYTALILCLTCGSLSWTKAQTNNTLPWYCV